MIGQFLRLYLVVSLLGLLALPLVQRLLPNLPDRGYALSKILGILSVSLLLWLGYSYGVLPNNVGGAWFAVLLFGALSLAAGWPNLVQGRATGRRPFSLSYVAFVELLFFLGFAAWAYVRAHDPAANHTEQPMDLMFMNSIWVSDRFPPQDAWLAGFAVSYYYLGYWLLATLGRLAGMQPEIVYNVGQAAWFGMLLITTFGAGYNLLAYRDDDEIRPHHRFATLGGFFIALWVAVAGNLQAVIEWLYANGVALRRLTAWTDVYNFPENAAQTGNWYIGFDWWWWRTSRVIEDLDLFGNHIEVIDEFPAFSYVLGDNHPHVMAMPVVLLVISLILNLFLQPRRADAPLPHDETAAQPASDVDGDVDRHADREAGSEADNEAVPALSPAPWWRQHLQGLIPAGRLGFAAIVAALGSLVFLNTWDFPPYWLLLLAATLFVAVERTAHDAGAGRSGWWPAVGITVVVGLAAVAGMILLYLPYFLTAQSQAGGFVPNLFYPTRLPQFLLMFGAFLPALIALMLFAAQGVRPGLAGTALALLLTLGLPAAFLAVSLLLATGTPVGHELLARIALPPELAGHRAAALMRWRGDPWTFLLCGTLLGLTAALIWARLEQRRRAAHHEDRATTFALLLAAVGLLLAFVPEFVYLRDNFGTRMNTIFKFYYQAWLLFALAGGYGIVRALGNLRRTSSPSGWIAAGAAGVAVALTIVSFIFLPAGAYSKTGGFASAAPTFDALAYVARQNPPEYAAIQWVRTQTPPDALIVEGKGASYRADSSRISAATGRPTLLGWDGHESQWRGSAYGNMAAGRPDVLELIYRRGSPREIEEALAAWEIDYVYVGPAERMQYDITDGTEARLQRSMELVFDDGNVRIYRRRG